MADAKAPPAQPGTPARKSGDLPVRLASAAVMLAIAALVLWRDGFWRLGFVVTVAGGVYVEYLALSRRIAPGWWRRTAAALTGLCYIGWAAMALVALPRAVLVAVIGLVVACDTGAYFTGRALGGPKLAPAISPGKTWSGLAGGMAAAGVWAGLDHWFALRFVAFDDLGRPFELGGVLHLTSGALIVLAGAALGAVAQAGDLYESWLKRRAGVKDSSRLIPGHGGLFDRVDGLLPVAIIVGTVWAQFAAAG